MESSGNIRSVKLNENQKLILRTLREWNHLEKQSQSHVASRAKLPWSTGKLAIDSLIKHGMLYVSKQKELHIAADCAHLCGISVGKKTTFFVVVDFNLQIVSKDRLKLSPSADAALAKCGFTPAGKNENDAVWSRETPTNSLTSIGNMLMSLAYIALELNENVPVLSIGMCFGDRVSEGMILRSSILKTGPVSNVDISKLLDRDMIERLRDENIRIVFQQNAKASLVAEQVLGCLKHNHAQHGILVYMGSGTGAAFLLNGKILKDAGALFGHVPVIYYDQDAEGVEPCAVCGACGCMETAIRPLFKTNEEDNTDYRSKSGAELAEWLGQKDHEKQRMLLAEYLSRSILREVAVLNLEFVVFSGKFATMFPAIERPFRAKASEQQLPSDLTILASDLGASVSALGAAVSAFFDWLGDPVD